MQRRSFLTKAALAATATSTALLAACAKKDKEAADVGAPRRRADLILITDGMVTHSDRVIAEARARAARLKVTIQGIGISLSEPEKLAVWCDDFCAVSDTETEGNGVTEAMGKVISSVLSPSQRGVEADKIISGRRRRQEEE